MRNGFQASDLETRREIIRALVKRVEVDEAEVLAELRDSGLMLGLISNVASPYKELFYHHRLDGYLSVALFSRDIGLRKPDPEIYRRMAGQLNLGLGEALMVGDRRGSDCGGPRDEGMEAVLLRRSGKDPGVRVIQSLRELLAEIIL